MVTPPTIEAIHDTQNATDPLLLSGRIVIGRAYCPGRAWPSVSALARIDGRWVDQITRASAHLRINPKGRIPVLSVDGRILTELPAILLFLALTDPGTSLAPDSPEGLAKCVEWFNWLSGTVHSVAIRQIWRPEDFTTDKTQTDNVIATGKKSLSEAFEYVEERMQDFDWAVGQQYSIVDPFLLVIHYWGSQIGFDMAGRYSAWTNHARRVLHRPEVQRAFAQEEIFAWA